MLIQATDDKFYLNPYFEIHHTRYNRYPDELTMYVIGANLGNWKFFLKVIDTVQGGFSCVPIAKIPIGIIKEHQGKFNEPYGNAYIFEKIYTSEEIDKINIPMNDFEMKIKSFKKLNGNYKLKRMKDGKITMRRISEKVV